MGFQINVEPSGHVFEAEKGETILDAALRQGVILPYGCRGGACGACRGKVLSGQIAHGIAQDFARSDADRAAGFALFCCASAQSEVLSVAASPSSAARRSAQQVRAEERIHATLRTKQSGGCGWAGGRVKRSNCIAQRSE